MELPSSDLFDLFMKLLPGFLAAAVFHSLTAYPKRDVFDRIVVALIFTLFAQILVGIVGRAVILIGSLGLVIGEWNSDSELSVGAFAGLALGVFVAWAVNSDWTHRPFRWMGITKRNSLPSEWCSAFSRLDRFIVLQLKDGRRLMGWPREWPDGPDGGHFVLERPTWVLDNGSTIRMHDIEAYLLPSADVEAVEFLRFSDDPIIVANAAEIEQAHIRLEESRKEFRNGDTEPAEEAGAEGDEPTGRSSE